MSWFYVILFLCFTFDNVSEARHHSKLPSAVVVGTVYCDTCFQQDFSKNSHFISGASVAVECKDESSRPSFHQEVKTNEHGEFRVNLPFSVGKHVKRIKKCSVKLLSSSEPYCAVASTATSSSLRLKSRKEGTHIFSAGFFSFKPQKQPILCNQKPSIQNSATDNFSDFPPPLQDPVNNNNFLPPLPILPPLSQLPPLAGLPSLPSPPSLPSIPSVPPKKSVKGSQQSDQKVAQPNFFLPTPPFFPPNPFQPPPILPPIFQPPPFFPPLLPPNPLQPPPAPLIPLPPIPFLTPPPPPPVIPFPPFTPFPPLPPLPPFPFPPPPRSPGIPPASTSHRTSSP